MQVTITAVPLVPPALHACSDASWLCSCGSSAGAMSSLDPEHCEPRPALLQHLLASSSQAKWGQFRIIVGRSQTVDWITAL
mmetsp:Transcript_73703/g.134828  ORF Transcript_73703/g.134828 Transcript_73703/m.134828 type:complete len:81 (+) Transcript_73703:365-607(+)